jgi:hypothetical protein
VGEGGEFSKTEDDGDFLEGRGWDKEVVHEYRNVGEEQYPMTFLLIGNQLRDHNSTLHQDLTWQQGAFGMW